MQSEREKPTPPVPAGTHTPGPWVVTGQSEGGRYISVKAGKTVVARVMFSREDDSAPCDHNNARLIAAAPDMLAMLCYVRDALDRHLVAQDYDALREDLDDMDDGVRAAIDRATYR